MGAKVHSFGKSALHHSVHVSYTHEFFQFGGDPDHVVIHGDSAGGGSVTYHLTVYGGEKENLFVGAISPYLPTHRTVAESEFQFNRFVENAQCSQQTDALACLRSKDTATLQSADVASRFPGATETPL